MPRPGMLSGQLVQRVLPQSRRLGPVVRHSFHRVPAAFDMLQAVTVSVKDVGERTEVTAAGGGLTRARAFFAGIGEAVERLSLRGHRQIRLSLGRYQDRGDKMDPRRFLHVTPDAVPELAGWTEDMEITWVEGFDLGNGRPLSVPGFAVFPAATAQTADGRMVIANTSTGTATARSPTDAIVAGLYEVIERDAFTAHWENQWPGVPVPIDAATTRLVERIRARNFDVTVHALAHDTGVPVALAVIRDRTGQHAAAAFGAAARANWHQAAFRAVEEALLTSFWISGRREIEGGTYREALSRMTGLPEPADHAFLYAYPEAVSACAFLYQDDFWPEPSFATVPAEAELAWLVARIAAVGASVVAVDITHPAAAALNLTVIRVLVPEFLPLARGQARPLTNPRLVTLGRALKRPHRADCGFNPDPHPFP